MNECPQYNNKNSNGYALFSYFGIESRAVCNTDCLSSCTTQRCFTKKEIVGISKRFILFGRSVRQDISHNAALNKTATDQQFFFTFLSSVHVYVSIVII